MCVHAHNQYKYNNICFTYCLNAFAFHTSNQEFLPTLLSFCPRKRVRMLRTPKVDATIEAKIFPILVGRLLQNNKKVTD